MLKIGDKVWRVKDGKEFTVVDVTPLPTRSATIRRGVFDIVARGESIVTVTINQLEMRDQYSPVWPLK